MTIVYCHNLKKTHKIHFHESLITLEDERFPNFKHKQRLSVCLSVSDAHAYKIYLKHTKGVFKKIIWRRRKQEGKYGGRK